jgi:hypothetical protein
LHADTAVFKGNIMKVTIKGYLHQCQYKWMSEPEFVLLSTVYKDNLDYIPVRQEPYEFEVEVPDDFDPRPQKVAALEEQKREAQIAFAKRIREIEDQISKCLAITA